MKHIILCADDYGQNSAISQAIILLVKNKRLSATSCMTTSENWLEEAQKLQPLGDIIDIGLHFNLTEGQPLSALKSFYSLSELIVKSQLRVLNQSAIETELHQQLDHFEAGIQRLPDFIDGHQHIQQLPIVRDALFQVYKKRFPKKTCYIRNLAMPLWGNQFKGNAQLKRIIIQLCGANSHQKQLAQLGIPHNNTFSGIYDFAYGKNYSGIFPHFLKEINNLGIIMCHPGFQSVQIEDPIASSREYEYQYLASEQFVRDCRANQIELGRFSLAARPSALRPDAVVSL